MRNWSLSFSVLKFCLKVILCGSLRSIINTAVFTRSRCTLYFGCIVYSSLVGYIRYTFFPLSADR